MSNEVDHFDRDGEPADRFHPDYDSFTDWLDAEAPADYTVKLHNAPRYPSKNHNATTVAALVKKR